MGSLDAGVANTMASATAAPGVNAAKSLTFRNSRVYIAFVCLVSIGSWCMAPLSVLMVFSLFAPPSHLGFNTFYGVLSCLASAYFFALTGRSMWILFRRMSFYRAQLDATGVTFRLGTVRQPVELSLAWNEIVAIHHKRLPAVQYYSVVRNDGGSVEWTSYTFVRPKKLAKLISERSGKPIDQLS